MLIPPTLWLLAVALLVARPSVVVGQQTPSPASAPQTLPVKRIRVSAGVQEAKLVHRVSPEYPPEARAAGISGTVRFQALISKEGKVARLDLVSGAPALVPAAEAAVRQWTYKPTLLNDEAIEVETWVDVDFSLLEPFTPAPSPTAAASAREAPADASAPSKTITVARNVQAPKLIHPVRPKYPSAARKKGISGTVRLHGTIGTDGKLTQLSVVSGDPLLTEAAIDAVKKWRYEPALEAGKPAAVETYIDVIFSLQH